LRSLLRSGFLSTGSSNLRLVGTSSSTGITLLADGSGRDSLIEFVFINSRSGFSLALLGRLDLLDSDDFFDDFNSF
jgi:hypothetical protein